MIIVIFGIILSLATVSINLSIFILILPFGNKYDIVKNSLVSDILVGAIVIVGAIVMPIAIVVHFNNYLQTTYMILDVLLCSASILNMCALSIKKYIDIFHPFTKIKQYIFIIIVWMIAFFVSLPQFFLQPFFSNTDSLVLHIHYQIYATGVSFYLPALIMILLYIKICHQVGIIKKIDHNIPQRRIVGHNRYVLRNRALKTLSITMICFLVCWLPFFVVVVLNTSIHFDDDIKTCVFWLGYCNSIVNPFIHIWFNKPIKQKFIKLNFNKLSFLVYL